MVRIGKRLPTGLSSLLRSLFVTAVVVVAYFVLPFTAVADSDTALFLVAGIVVVAVLLVWQIRAITVSPHPRVRAVEALALTVPLFLVIFATTYYVMDTVDHQHFSQPLTRVDSLYFTLTVFATVGFGDIVAVSEPARVVVVVQIVGDLVLVGFIAHAIVDAVQEGLARRKRG